MDVHLFLVQARSRSSVPAVHEAAGKFTEETEAFPQVKIGMQKVALHQVRISGRVIRPVWVADAFAALPNPEAKREVVVLVLTKGNILDRIEEAGSAVRRCEVLNPLVVGR